MPWAGDSFELLYDFVEDRNLGQPDSRISATKVMAMFTDIAEGLEDCLNVSGTNAPTAAYDWNGQRITNLGTATSRTDAVPAQQIATVNYAGTLTEGADVNTLSGTVALAPSTITAGYIIEARFASSNTGAMTLNLNSAGATAIRDRYGNALASGDIVAGTTHLLCFDGTYWRVLTPITSETAAGTVGLTNVATPLTGNGTTSALDINFANLVAADTQAIATKLAADATALATLNAAITGAIRVNCSASEPTGANAAVGCFWVRLPELIVYMRVEDENGTEVWMDISTPAGGATGSVATVNTGTLVDDAVTNAKLANMATSRIKGRVSSGSGDPEDLTPSQVGLLLNDNLPTVTNTSVSGTYTPDMDAGVLFDLTVVGTTTIAAPTNVTAGQMILFRIAQDGTGNRTVSWNGAYNWGSAGAPVMSTAAADVDWAAGIVRTSGNIEMLSFVAGF